MDHRNDDYENILFEIIRAIQRGFDAVVGFISHIAQMIVNIDLEKLGQEISIAIQQGMLFIIENERSVAIVLFVLSIFLGFPIGTFLGILLVIPQVVLLATIRCLGFTQSGIERGSLAAGYQSRTYGGYIPSSSSFARHQSRGATGLRLESNPWLILLSWISMIASVVLFLDYLHRGQVNLRVV
ncbi:hypothetical protein AX15_000538 [Amanita polypyramis BW_CC]|nr:hypothetical protein AX15_000538 [Amanita polypyramis BW_CC]